MSQSNGNGASGNGRGLGQNGNGHGMGVLRWTREMWGGFKTVLVGMRVTMRHLFQPPVTMHYPDEKWVMPDGFRGLIKCDVDACIVCDLCAKSCPVDCITIEWKREEGKAGKVCTKFEVDFNKCMYCGLCVEPCPTDAIFHSHEYENASTSKDDMVMDFVLPKYYVKNPKAKPPKPTAAAKAASAPAKATSPAAPTHALTPSTATATAAPPTAEKPITKVWIAEGCIVCDACEDACPEVFDVQETTCIVKPLDDYKSLTDKIIEAAVACPVNVIKYE